MRCKQGGRPRTGLVLATGARAGVRSEGERLRFGGASEGEETDMETDPSSAPSPSPSSSHAPFASAEAAGARPQLALLVLRRKKVLELLTAWPHPAERERVRMRLREKSILDVFFSWAHVSGLANGKNQMEGGWDGLGEKKKAPFGLLKLG